jgi:chorismate synthase
MHDPAFRESGVSPISFPVFDLAAFERSDITAVPAAGVIGEAMLAIVIANAMREKFGGDSLQEMSRNFLAYETSMLEY